MADFKFNPSTEEINEALFGSLAEGAGISNVPEPESDVSDESYASSLEMWKNETRRKLVEFDLPQYEKNRAYIDSRLDSTSDYYNRVKTNKDIGAARDVVNRIGGGLLNHVIGDTLSFGDFVIDTFGGDSNMGGNFAEGVERQLPTNPAMDGSALAIGIDAATQAASFVTGAGVGKLATMSAKAGKVGGAIKYAGRKLPIAQMIGLSQKEARGAYDKVLSETGSEDQASFEYFKSLLITTGLGTIPVMSLGRIMKKGALPVPDEANPFVAKSFFNKKDLISQAKYEAIEETLQTALSNVFLDYTLRGDKSGGEAIVDSLTDQENIKEMMFGAFGGAIGGAGAGVGIDAVFTSDFNKAVRGKRAKVMNDAYKSKDDFYAEAGKDGDLVVKHKLSDVKDIDTTLQAYDAFINEGGVDQEQINIAVEEMNVLKGMKEELITQFRQQAKKEGREPEFNHYLARQGIVIEEGPTLEEAEAQEVEAISALETEQANLEQIDETITTGTETLNRLGRTKKILSGVLDVDDIDNLEQDFSDPNFLANTINKITEKEKALNAEKSSLKAKDSPEQKQRLRQLDSQIKLAQASKLQIKNSEEVAKVETEIEEVQAEKTRLQRLLPILQGRTTQEGAEMMDITPQERVGVELARLKQQSGLLAGKILGAKGAQKTGWKNRVKKLQKQKDLVDADIKNLDNSSSLNKKRQTIVNQIQATEDLILAKKNERDETLAAADRTIDTLKQEALQIQAGTDLDTKARLDNIDQESNELKAAKTILSSQAQNQKRGINTEIDSVQREVNEARGRRKEATTRLREAQDKLEEVRKGLDLVFNRDAEGNRTKAFIKVGSGIGTANFSNKLSDDVKRYTTGLLSGLQNDADVTIIARSDLRSPRVATMLGLKKGEATQMAQQFKNQRAVYIPDLNTIMFNDDIDLSDQGATTIGHEIGHAIVESAIAKSPQLREKLERAYADFIKSQIDNTKDRTINTAKATQAAVEPSRLEEVDRVEEGLDVSMNVDTYLGAKNKPRLTKDVKKVSDGSAALSFNEWMAQQVNKAIQTKMADTPLGKFFNDVADSLKALYARVTQKAPAAANIDPTIQSFVDSIFNSAAQKAALQQFGKTASDRGPGSAPQGDSTTGPTDTKGDTETKADTSKSVFFKEPRNKEDPEDAEFMKDSLRFDGLAEEKLNKSGSKEARPEDIVNPEDFIKFLGDMFRPEGEQRYEENKLKETILGSDAFSKEAKDYVRRHADDDHAVQSQKETMGNALAYIKTFGVNKSEEVFFDDNIPKRDGFGIALGNQLARVFDQSATLAKKQGLLQEAADLRSRGNEILLRLSNLEASSGGRTVSMFRTMVHGNSPTSIRYLLNRTIKKMARDTGDKNFKLTEETDKKLESLAEELLRAKELNSPFLVNRAVGEMATSIMQDTKLYQADRLINWVYMNMLNGLNTTIGVNPFGNFTRFLAVTLPTILSNPGFRATALQAFKDAMKYTPQEAYNVFMYGESPESTDLSKLNISQSQEDILSKVRRKIQELSSKDNRTSLETAELYLNKYIFHPLENINNYASFRALQSVDFLFFASNEMIYRQGLMAAELLKADPNLTGEQLATAVSNQLYGTDENGNRGSYESNKDQAISNLKEVMGNDKFMALSPAEKKRLVHKEMFSIAANNTPAPIKALAELFAAESTFTQNPTGVLGRMSEMLERFMRSGTKKMRSDDRSERIIGYAQVATRMALAPFNRVVFNVTNELLNFTPIGEIRRQIGTETRYDATTGRETVPLSDLKKQQLRTQTAIGMAVPIVATAIMASEWDLPDDEKTISIYGDLQGASPARKQQLKEAGITPYSIRLGGGLVVSFKDSVLRIPLGMVGDLADGVRFETRMVPWNLLDGVEEGTSIPFRDLTPEDQQAVMANPEFWIDPASNAVGGFLATLGDASPLGGVGGIATAISAVRFGGFADVPAAIGDSTLNIAGRAMPWNAPLLRDAKVFTGDYVIDRKDTSEVLGMEFPNPATYFLGNTPFAGEIGATRPALNVFGEPITEKMFITNRIGRTFTQSPEFAWLGNNHIALSQGSPIIGIKFPGSDSKSDSAELKKIYSARAMDDKIINVAKGNLNDEEAYQFRRDYIGPKLKEIVSAFAKNTNPEENRPEIIKELNKRVETATAIMKQQFLDDKYGTSLVEEKDRKKLEGLTLFNQ